MNKIILTFIGAHFAPFGLGGRKISVPLGISLGLSPGVVLLLAFALDFIQIPIFYLVYSGIGRLIFYTRSKSFVARIAKLARARTSKAKTKQKKNRILKWAKKVGPFGIFVVAAIPFFGCGVWTATLLAYITKTKKPLAYFLISLGILISTLFLIFTTKGFLIGINAFFE